MLIRQFLMCDPKMLYDLRYYARKRGYYFHNNLKIVTVPERKRSERIEERLRSFGYYIQLNLFCDEN